MTKRSSRPRGKDLPTLSFATRSAWWSWLATHHSSSRGLWLKIAKKGSKSASITYTEALEAALAWGWIDGQKGKLDDAWWLQKFTPRGPRSTWSKINREKALALIETGVMQPAGLAEVERAKRDGRWETAYESQSRTVMPADLAKALASNTPASLFFEKLDSRNRYAVLFRIQMAKKPETRAKRIEKFVGMLAKHEKLHP